jgi:hypothetical protein
MTVLGYTYTDYGRRDVAVVAAEVDRYKSWYSVSGIFFDEMSNAVGGESYYSYLSLHAKAIGLSYIVGNPGTAVPSTYVGTVDVIVTYEASGLPTPATLATSDASSLRRDQMAVIAYGVSSLDGSSMDILSSYVGYVYVTDGVLPNPYGALPAYFAGLMASLGNVAPGRISILVRSVALDGSPIADLMTQVSANGSVVASGYSPAVFSVAPGNDYKILVGDSGTQVFDHWEDGSTDPIRMVVPTRSITLTAYFRNTAALSVTSVDLQKSPPKGKIGMPPMLDVKFHNNFPTQVTGIVRGAIYSPSGKIIAYTTFTISPAGSASAWAYLNLGNRPSGTYTVIITSFSNAGKTLSDPLAVVVPL